MTSDTELFSIVGSKRTKIIYQLRDLHPEQNERFPWNDVGSAALFVEVFKESIRYVADKGIWYIYDNTRWVPDVGGVMVDELAKLLALELHHYAVQLSSPVLQQGYAKFTSRWAQRRTRDTILRDARSINPTKAAAFDFDLWVLNVNNGVIDLRTGRARSRKPSDMLSKLAPVTFDPNARCERWERFVDEVTCGDAELASFIQRVIGYSLTGDTSRDVFFIFHGPSSRNGKSTLAETIRALLGDYACSAQPDTFAERKLANGSAPTEDLARLAGRRFITLPEPDAQTPLSSMRLKQFTGSDTLSARMPYGSSFEFTPCGKLFFNCNDTPRCSDPAIFNSGRALVIPFNRHFDLAEQDHGLKQYFKQPENQSGILNWGLEGLRLYQAQGLNPPEAVLEATQAYAEREGSRPTAVHDTIGRFFSEAMEECLTSEVTSAAAYAAYVDWCERASEASESLQQFGRRVKREFLTARKRPVGGGEKSSVIVGYRLKGA